MTMKVTDLVEGDQFEFHVAAENKAGIGAFSPPSQPITAKDPWNKPGKPGRPEGTNVTGYTMDLAWTAPADDGGAEITDYVIEYRVQGTPKWQQYKQDAPNPDTKATAKGLKEDTYYEFRVAAVNKAGQGPFSDPSEPIKTQIGRALSLSDSIFLIGDFKIQHEVNNYKH